MGLSRSWAKLAAWSLNWGQMLVIRGTIIETKKGVISAASRSGGLFQASTQ